MHLYRELNPDSILKTLERLKARIEERFPQRGIARVCAELLEVARSSTSEAAQMAQPSWWLRAALLAAIGLGASAFLYLVHLLLKIGKPPEDISGFVQGLDAFFNIVVLSGLAVAFLLGAEKRYKGKRALQRLYELRSFSHVIDMHQLTKDPSITIGVARARPTASSPARNLSSADLMRYLDYCTEMLAIIGKLAALYAQNLRDPATIAAVNEIEELTSDLSRKIWQKLIIMYRDGRDAETAAADLLTVLHKAEG
jgi:hypothetical protein